MGTPETKLQKTFLERSLYGYIVKNDTFTEHKISHYKISNVCKLIAIYGPLLHGGSEENSHQTGRRQEAAVISAPKQNLPPISEQTASC